MRLAPTDVPPLDYQDLRIEVPHWGLPPTPQEEEDAMLLLACIRNNVEGLNQEQQQVVEQIAVVVRDGEAFIRESLIEQLKRRNSTVQTSSPHQLVDPFSCELRSKGLYGLVFEYLESKGHDPKHIELAGPVLGRNPSQNGGHVVVSIRDTGKILWAKTIYRTEYDDSWETDCQDVFISEIEVNNEILVVRDEARRTHQVALRTGALLISPVGNEPWPGSS